MGNQPHATPFLSQEEAYPFRACLVDLGNKACFSNGKDTLGTLATKKAPGKGDASTESIRKTCFLVRLR